MTGWIRLHRGWRDCDAFGDEPMTEREAWVWLIEKAAWKPCVRRSAKGERIEIDRGQFHTSLRNLGEAWGWGKNKVDRYLQRLEDHEMIGTVAGQSGCTITICNYDEYQDGRDSVESSGGTVAGQSRDTQEEIKQPSEDKSSSVVSIAREPKTDPFPRPDFAHPQVWSDFLKNRKLKKMTNSATAYRGFLSDISKEQDANWPPGRLLEHAAIKGWGSIHNPDKDAANELSRRTALRPQQQKSSRAARLLDTQRAADAEAERRNIADHPTVGRALSAERWNQ